MQQWKQAAICVVAAIISGSHAPCLADNENKAGEPAAAKASTAGHVVGTGLEAGNPKPEEKKNVDATIESVSHNSASLTAMLLVLLVVFMCMLGILATLLGARKYIVAKAEKLRTDDYERILSFLSETKREELAGEWLTNWNSKNGKSTSIRKLDELQKALSELNREASAKFTVITQSLVELSKKLEEGIKQLLEQLKKLIDSHIAMKLDTQLKANTDRLKDLETNTKKVSEQLKELIEIQKEIQRNTQAKK